MVRPKSPGYSFSGKSPESNKFITPSPLDYYPDEKYTTSLPVFF